MCVHMHVYVSVCEYCVSVCVCAHACVCKDSVVLFSGSTVLFERCDLVQLAELGTENCQPPL